MAGVMPSLSQPVNPNLGGDYLRQLAAGDLAATDQMRKYRQAQMENYTDLSKSAMSNADDMSEVFGGMAVGPMLESMLGSSVWGYDASGNPLTPLSAGQLSGSYTGQADTLRLADMAATVGQKNRSGRGGNGAKGGSAKYYVRGDDGKLYGSNSESGAATIQQQVGGDFALPEPGETVYVYGSSGTSTFVYGGDSFNVGGGGGSGLPSDAELDEALNGVDKDDPDAVAEALREDGRWPNAIVKGGDVYVSPDSTKPIF